MKIFLNISTLAVQRDEVFHVNLGRVLGTCVATQRDASLLGVTLLVVQPINDNLDNVGALIVAADPIGARPQDIVMWVGSREASLALENKFAPVDAAVVGLVDRLGSRNVEAEGILVVGKRREGDVERTGSEIPPDSLNLGRRS